MEDISEFLRETDCIDFSNPLIVQKADELKAASSDEVDYIERAYRFATENDTALSLQFIKELASYEKMLSEVVADEATLKEQITWNERL